MKRIVVIDYGLGNIRSAMRGLERAGAQVEVTSDSTRFGSADGLVLPGVGAFKSGMQNRAVIPYQLLTMVPILPLLLPAEASLARNSTQRSLQRSVFEY